MFFDKIFTKIALFGIWIYQKTFSSHTGIFKDFLYDKPVCVHKPHCSEYAKEVFQKYGFKKGLKYTMERIDKCKPDTTISYDPSSYKIVYFCSAPIGIPFLDELAKDQRFEISGIVAGADKPQGRGQKIKSNIIKTHALENLKIDPTIIKTPSKLTNNEEFLAWLKSLNADFFVVLSYGKILKKEILEIPQIGPINIHGSILPKYRGASPIQSVFLNQEKQTGITAIFMDEKMDTGDIIDILSIELKAKDNALSLIEKFGDFGPKRFCETLRDFGKGNLKRQKQDENLTSYCSKFEVSDALIDFQESAQTIYSKFQAFYLRPKIYTNFKGKKLQILDCFFEEIENPNVSIGEFFQQDGDLKAKTGHGNLVIYELKLEGKKTMSGKDFVNGYL